MCDSDLSNHSKITTIRLFAFGTFLRLWLAFSFGMILGILASTTIERPDLLSDDNAYIIGFLFGSIAAGFALIYSFAESHYGLARLKNRIAGSALGVWCLMLAVGEFFTEGEGDGILMLSAIVSLLVGVLTWPFCTFRIPVWIRLLISAAGIIVLLAYGYVYIRMSSSG